jgi:hypothetical protein
MTSILQALLDRVLKNPKSTFSAIAPMIVGLIARLGFDVSVDLILQVLTTLYGIILLFWKDAPKEVPVNQFQIMTSETPKTLFQIVDEIVKKGENA